MKLRLILTALCLCFYFLPRAQTAKKSLLYNLVNQKQQTGEKITSTVLFKQSAAPVQKDIAQIVKQSAVLELDKTATIELYGQKPVALALAIPFGLAHTFTLRLARQQVNDFGDFAFGTINAQGIRSKSNLDQGLHYRGYIDGDPSSIAAISFFEDGTVMGIFAGQQGNFVIGKTKVLDGYTVYNSGDMLVSPNFDCAAERLPNVKAPKVKIVNTPTQNDVAILCKKVRLYWEGDFELYRDDFGSSLINTRNYLAGLFNQVAAVYQNEGIQVELSEAYVWTAPDPYNNSTSSRGLDSFKVRWNRLGNQFNGDLAHLISGGTTNNGGLAYLLTNNMCYRSYAYGYSNVYGYYNSLPTYSWDVMVLSHELGHNMGSNHTQWCGWDTGPNGICGAIDNCATVEMAGCDTCPAYTNIASPPSGFKGTIMSYCHTRNGIGINLSLGFGPLPSAAIRETVEDSYCTLLSNYWTGAASTAWENTANWSCGILPNANTDVVVVAGAPNYPVVNSAASCHRLQQMPGTNIKISTGRTLTVVGQ